MEIGFDYRLITVHSTGPDDFWLVSGTIKYILGDWKNEWTFIED